MKNRFSREKKNKNRRNLFVSIGLFAAIFLAVCFGLFSISAKTDEEELQTLEKALTRGITYCYAMEGNYPRSIDDLKENYGLTYNEDKYFIDYQPLGANIMPDITIIRKTDK